MRIAQQPVEQALMGRAPVTADFPYSASSAAHAFQILMHSVRAALEERLGRLLQRKAQEASCHGEDVHAMAHSVMDLTLRGGKRFRPALLHAAFQACGGQAGDPCALDAGVALELLQTYLLIHDDWMDHDRMRRGGPSVHVMLAEHFGSPAKGEAAAILAGDYACALAQEALAQAACEPTRIVQAMVLFAQIQQDVICGQVLDLTAQSAQVERMHALKTGSYTVRGPLLLGALLTAATSSQSHALEAYAAPLGVAFQLRDDLLGCFGAPEQTGKPLGSDLRAGKRTALITEAESRLSAQEQQTLQGAFGHAEASEITIREATAALEQCGARQAVEARITTLVAEALSGLQQGSFDPTGKHLLVGAAAALTTRAG